MRRGRGVGTRPSRHCMAGARHGRASSPMRGEHMSELSDAPSRLLGRGAWGTEPVARGVTVGADAPSDAGTVQLRPSVADPASRRGSLSVAEPYEPSPEADRIATSSTWITRQAWVLGELVAVLVVALTVAWSVDAGML